VTAYANLAGVEVGDGFPVRLVGAINVSPESFYPGSVAATEDSVKQRAERMAAEGADLLDIGAMSTAPYLPTEIPEAEEIQRVTWAIGMSAWPPSPSRSIPREAGWRWPRWTPGPT